MSETSSVVLFKRGALLLAEANTVQKAKELKDLSLTAGEWAKRKGMGEEAVQYCRGYALEAERRMGELLAETERAKGTAGAGRPKIGSNRTIPPNSQSPTLAELGVSKRESAEAQMLAEIPRAEFDKVKAGKRTKAQVRRAVREKKRERKRRENAAKVAAATKPEQLAGKFTTIVIDPPWDWGDEGDVNQMGRAKPDFASMSIDQLEKLPVAALADSDCHLYLWITNRSMPKGFRLLEAWGFRHVTILTWPKPSFGMGNYFRGQTEHVLFGVKGSLMLKRKNASTLLPAWKRGRGHSAKPPEFLEFVESCSSGPYLEMFSRSQRQGWTAWGENSK